MRSQNITTLAIVVGILNGASAYAAGLEYPLPQEGAKAYRVTWVKMPGHRGEAGDLGRILFQVGDGPFRTIKVVNGISSTSPLVANASQWNVTQTGYVHRRNGWSEPFYMYMQKGDRQYQMRGAVSLRTGNLNVTIRSRPNRGPKNYQDHLVGKIRARPLRAKSSR